ncbi:metallophosphoesterase [Polyangium sp. 6x1]|nr:metallophosphoesterase [Polyangium sp. 6x1]
MAMGHLNIAILGDTHGHLTLAYRILKRWQEEEGQRIDLILQVGDFGAFPPPYRLDKATKRFAESDPDELGFTAYFQGEPEAEEILGPDAAEHRRIDADTIFIRGNHEDFSYLCELAGADEGPVPVDAFDRIHYLKSGVPFTYEKDGHSLRIAGLGGIADEDGNPVKNDGGECYTRQDVKRLFALKERLDVFLSHEPPLDAAIGIHPKYAGAGSRAAREFIQNFQPTYHFCGHYHEEGQEIFFTSTTRSYHMNAVGFWRPHRLNPGCIGILQWQGARAIGMSFLDAPWLKEYTKSTYRYL